MPRLRSTSLLMCNGACKALGTHLYSSRHDYLRHSPKFDLNEQTHPFGRMIRFTLKY